MRALVVGSKSRDGKIKSEAGLHPKPDITLFFKNAATGASLLTPPINWLHQINAQKDFMLRLTVPRTSRTGSLRFS